MEIKTALLHCPEDNFFNLQSVLARTLELDEKGELWLSVDKPVNCPGNGDASFDVVLNYHRTGCSFDLDILGEAWMVSEQEEMESLSPNIITAFQQGKLILRVRIIDIDYWEHKTPVFKSIAQKLRYMFSAGINTVHQQVHTGHKASAWPVLQHPVK